MITHPTQEYVRELFEYRNSNLYWKVTKGRRGKIGNLAGHAREDGYRDISINRKLYYTHRLIFLYHHGYLPKFLDHIDRNRANNSISNLREVTNQENGMNQKKTKFINGKPTSSRFKGVSWDKECGKWKARIGIGGKDKHIGRYNSEIDAALAYDRAAIQHYGEFAVTNKYLGLL